MPKKTASLGSFLCCGLVWTLGIPTIGLAQVTAQSPAVPVASLSVANRLTQPISPTALVSIKATVHPLANAANDRGAAPDGMPLVRREYPAICGHGPSGQRLRVHCLQRRGGRNGLLLQLLEPRPDCDLLFVAIAAAAGGCGGGTRAGQPIRQRRHQPLRLEQPPGTI
jgi:hypothetical protein